MLCSSVREASSIAEPSPTDATSGTMALTRSARSANVNTLTSVNTSHSRLTPMTTLEAAEQFGYFTTESATRFLNEHGLTFAEAESELGDMVLCARTLCQWIGY